MNDVSKWWGELLCPFFICIFCSNTIHFLFHRFFVYHLSFVIFVRPVSLYLAMCSFHFGGLSKWTDRIYMIKHWNLCEILGYLLHYGVCLRVLKHVVLYCVPCGPKRNQNHSTKNIYHSKSSYFQTPQASFLVHMVGNELAVEIKIVFTTFWKVELNGQQKIVLK